MADTAWIYDVVAAIAAHDGERAAAFFAENACFEAVSVGLRVTGRSAIADMLGPASDGFSKEDQLDVESVVSDGDVFAVQWRSRGIRNSDGQNYDYRGASVGRLQDGLITSWTDYFDPSPMGLSAD